MSIRFDENGWQRYEILHPQQVAKFNHRFYYFGLKYKERCESLIDLGSCEVFQFLNDCWESSRNWTKDDAGDLSAEMSEFLGDDWADWAGGSPHVRIDLEDTSCELENGIWEQYPVNSDDSNFALMQVRIWKRGKWSNWFQPRLAILQCARVNLYLYCGIALQWEILKGVDKRGRPRKS